MPDRTAYVDGLQLLGRRELSVQQLRGRLLDRGHAAADVARAVALLLEHKALDDARVAAAYVRTALKVKGRGRLRIRRELQRLGIDAEVAETALADAFGEVDERALIRQALDKKLRGRKPASVAEAARLFQYLLRQGFSPAAATSVLRAARRASRED